jgi:hypothetical protein
MGSTGNGAALGRGSNIKGVYMKINPAGARAALVFTCFVLIISLLSCSPKCVVRGRVMDAETQQPIQGAAVAIRWFSDGSEQQPAETVTLDAVQALSDEKGIIKIPQYPDRKYILGVYKNGYICWSSRDIFSIASGAPGAEIYHKRKNHQLKEGMTIDLTPLNKRYPRNLHAGFTMMVAGESTDTDSGPFHQAIQPEYQLWRENLRKDFQKQVGAK